MSGSAGARSLRGPVGAAAGLLVAGVAVLVAHAEVLQWGWYWDAYRRNVAEHAQLLAKEAARHVVLTAQLAAPPPRPAFTLQLAVMQAKVPAMSVLVLGVMAMLLVAYGHRVAWLPIVAAATLLNDPAVVINGYGDWTSATGRSVCVAVIALAVTPLVVATRGRTPARIGVPRPALGLAAAAVGVSAAIVYVGPPHADVPRPAAAAALLLYGLLIAASSLPRRWLLAALVLPALALPGIGWAVGDANPGSEASAAYVALAVLAYYAVVAGVRPPRRWLPIALAAPLLAAPQLAEVLRNTGDRYSPTMATFVVPLLVALGIVAVGAAVPLFGQKCLDAWARTVRREPLISGRNAEPVAT